MIVIFLMIKSQITIKHLETFVCVVDMGSFRKAATVLGTTQPNISNRISLMENSLGLILMHRDSGSVQLTQKGHVLLEAARRVLWSAEAFLEAASRKDLIADRMRLGVTELVACTWLHDFLRRFRTEYPSIAVELQVDLSVEIEKDLTASHLDLALQTGPFQTQSSGCIPLGTYPYIWVASPGIVVDIGTVTTVSTLLKTPVLVHARHSQASKELLRVAETRRMAVDRVVFSSSLASCLQMAMDGMGVSLLPEVLVAAAIGEGRLLRLECDWLPPPLQFFARFDKAKAPRFIEAAAQIAAGTAREMDH